MGCYKLRLKLDFDIDTGGQVQTGEVLNRLAVRVERHRSNGSACGSRSVLRVLVDERRSRTESARAWSEAGLARRPRACALRRIDYPLGRLIQNAMIVGLQPIRILFLIAMLPLTPVFTGCSQRYREATCCASRHQASRLTRSAALADHFRDAAGADGQNHPRGWRTSNPFRAPPGDQLDLKVHVITGHNLSRLRQGDDAVTSMVRMKNCGR